MNSIPKPDLDSLGPEPVVPDLPTSRYVRTYIRMRVCVDVRTYVYTHCMYLFTVHVCTYVSTLLIYIRMCM